MSPASAPPPGSGWKHAPPVWEFTSAAHAGVAVALHGVTGRGYRLPEHDDWDPAELADTAPSGDDWDPDWHSGRWNVDRDRPHVMAESLSTFVRLVTAWVVLRQRRSVGEERHVRADR
ncbi:hypothetical protein ACFV9W_31935 [Streptomyces sp. NPDC059897]|uniref:hypothetical protein n=1 Tax=Streptomyces sp. NPDC059897 TaxID=3346994 RepID=UPI003666A370